MNSVLFQLLMRAVDDDLLEEVQRPAKGPAMASACGNRGTRGGLYPYSDRPIWLASH